MAVLLLVMGIAEVGLFVVPGVVVGETTRVDMEVVEQAKNDTEAHMNVICHHVIMAGMYHMHVCWFTVCSLSTCTFLIWPSDHCSSRPSC